MLSDNEYVRTSLEVNLFFLRISKEHIIFASASLPPRDTALMYQALALKNQLEQLLSHTVLLSHGMISPEVINSGEIVTELTLPAEKKTQALTGIPIDSNITNEELTLGTPLQQRLSNPQLAQQVSFLNQQILRTMNTAITFKSNLLKNILNCTSFSYTYPLMLDHVIRESHFYVLHLTRIQNRVNTDSEANLIEEEITWNDIMNEHSKFIRGYLDPSESKLIETANSFDKKFEILESSTKRLSSEPNRLPEVTKESLNLVTSLRNFKLQGTEGILACKVRSIIPPLLGDHVTREANHYLRLLRSFTRKP